MRQREENKHTDGPLYPRELSRRETLKWMGVMSSTVVVPMTFSTAASAKESAGDFAPWPPLTLKPVTEHGYGQAQNLIVPEPAPWPRVLTEPQLAMVGVLSDIILPAEAAW